MLGSVLLGIMALLANTLIGCVVCEWIDDDRETILRWWKKQSLTLKIVFVNAWPVVAILWKLGWIRIGR